MSKQQGVVQKIEVHSMDSLKGKKLLIFGEIHGTKEIPKFLYDYISKIIQKKKINLCLEIPSELQPEMNNFMRKNDEALLDILKAEDKFRYSFHYLEFLRKLRKHRESIKSYCVESESFSQEGKDEGLAKSILKVMRNKRLTIAYMGDLHASKNAIHLGNLDMIPAGHFLALKLGNKIKTIRFILNKKRTSKEEETFNLGFNEIIPLIEKKEKK